MYAGILGKHKDISLTELRAAGCNIIRTQGSVVFFSGPDHHRAGLTKWGRVVTDAECDLILSEPTTKLIGSNDIKRAGSRKRQYNHIKRFKETDTLHSDLEIKRKGVEIIVRHNELIHITHYQNIPLYETIDLHKPASGMQIGMMPAKLTHQLISIGVYTHQQNHTTDTQPTIRDPFVGFGTTSIVTNAYSYNTIGSDINISQAKQNITRRSDHALSTDAKITLRKHDMTTPLTDPVYEYADIIVSEGRLGPVVTGRTQTNTLHDHAARIAQLYTDTRAQLDTLEHRKTMIITITEYDRYDGAQPYDLVTIPDSRTITALPETYRRARQKVGRKILIIQK